MLCEVLQSPSNGFVVLPCNREFQSMCTVTCEDGYYTEGPYTQSCKVGNNGIVEWSTAPVCRGMYLGCNRKPNKTYSFVTRFYKAKQIVTPVLFHFIAPIPVS